MDNASEEGPGHLRGLFDGFDGYQTPSDEEYDRVLNAGLVVLDSNVLLNLYRYNAQARDDFFTVLDKLGGRLWIPHQVAAEFWRNRENASEDLISAGKRAIADIEGHKNQAMESLRTWANRVSLEKVRVEDLEKAIREGVFSHLRHNQFRCGREY